MTPAPGLLVSMSLEDAMDQSTVILIHSLLQVQPWWGVCSSGAEALSALCSHPGAQSTVHAVEDQGTKPRIHH